MSCPINKEAFNSFIDTHWDSLLKEGSINNNSKPVTLHRQIETIASILRDHSLKIILLGPSNLLEPAANNFGLLSDNQSQIPKKYRHLQESELGLHGAILAMTPWTTFMNDAFVLLALEDHVFHLPFADSIPDGCLWDNEKNKPTHFGRELLLLKLAGSTFHKSDLGIVVTKKTGSESYPISLEAIRRKANEISSLEELQELLELSHQSLESFD